MEIEKQQVHNLQHSLGFCNGKKPITFFRNYWVGENEDNKALVKFGYMEKYVKFDKICYRVLPKGIDFLLGYGFSEKNKKKLLETSVLFERDYEE